MGEANITTGLSSWAVTGISIVGVFVFALSMIAIEHRVRAKRNGENRTEARQTIPEAGERDQNGIPWEEMTG